MAINKEKNVLIQVTFPKEDAEQLETLKKAFENNGIKVSKSGILVKALRDYIRLLVMATAQPKKEQEDKEEKENA